jgi:hypothetical protein
MDRLVSIPLMGHFSLSTASLVLLYKGSPTCPVTASRVSYLSSNSLLSHLLLPVTETVPSIRPSDLAAEAALYHSHLYRTQLYATVATV